jgi:hypothetical protein
MMLNDLSCRHSSVIEAMMAVGILSDDRQRYDLGVQTFKDTGMGLIRLDMETKE